MKIHATPDEELKQIIRQDLKDNDGYCHALSKVKVEKNINIYEIMQEIGKKRGAIISGGNVDDEKTAKIILEDFRSAKLGRITIERID